MMATGNSVNVNKKKKYELILYKGAALHWIDRVLWMCDINGRCAHILSDMQNNYTGFPEIELKAEMKLEISTTTKT